MQNLFGSTRVEDFMAYAMDVAYTLRGNGCSRLKLRRAFSCFVSEHVRKYRGSHGASLLKVFAIGFSLLKVPSGGNNVLGAQLITEFC